MMPFNCLSKRVVQTGRNQLSDLTGAKRPVFELSGDLSPEPPTWIRRCLLTYLHTFVHSHTYIHTYTQTYIHTHTYLPTYMHTYIHRDLRINYILKMYVSIDMKITIAKHAVLKLSLSLLGDLRIGRFSHNGAYLIKLNFLPKLAVMSGEL